MTYFRNLETLEELRKQYKELLKKFHPDNTNGSTEATQEINTEYDRLFKILKNKHEIKQTKTDGAKTDFNSNYWNYEEDKAIREMLQKIIHFTNITIEICGTFIWISGNSYPYRKELKEIGFKWASQKKQWYWFAGGTFRKKSNKPLSMDDIRNYYGSTEVRPEERLRLKQA